MKKLLIAVSIMVLPTMTMAGLFDTSPNTKIVKPTHYKVEARGRDLRVYEWTPRDNSNLTCMFVGGVEKGGLVCYPKSEQ